MDGTLSMFLLSFRGNFNVYYRYLDIFLRDYYGMKVLRVARILKFAYTSKGMKSLLTPLVASIVQLPDVILYLFVFLLMFGIIETFQFQGTFFYRCRKTEEPVNGVWEIERDITRFCSPYGYGDYTCPASTYCGYPDMYDLDVTKDNITDLFESYYYVVGYDTVVKAVLANIQILTYEGWVDMMYKMNDSMNRVFGRLFYPIFIYVCAFFALNLIVAAIVDALLKNRQQDDEEEIITQETMINTQTVPQTEPQTEQPKTLVAEKEEAPSKEDISAKISKEDNSAKHSFDPGNVLQSPKELFQNSESAEEESEEDALEVAIPESSCWKTASNVIVMVVLLANIFVMCFDRLGSSNKEQRIIDYIDTGFFAILLSEMVLKIAHDGFRAYIKAGANTVIDIIVNVTGLIEVIFTYTSLADEYYTRGFIIIFRAIRVLKLFSKWETLSDTVIFIWITLSDIINFMILLAIFVCIYAVIGMELFAGKVKFNNDDMLDVENGESPKYNFDSLPDALIASYSLVISDSWSSFLYPYSRLNYTIGVVYFYTGIYVLNVFFVNVFVAIILQNFYVDEKKKEWEEQERKDKEDAEQFNKNNVLPVKGYKGREKILLIALKMFKTIINLSKMCKARKKQIRSILVGSSMFFLSDNNGFRMCIFHLIQSVYFRAFSLTLTFISSVIMTFCTPLYDPNGSWVRMANVINYIIVSFFFLEIFMKVIAYGLIFNGNDSYFRNGGNIVDFISTVSMFIRLVANIPAHTVFGKTMMSLSIIRIVRITTMRKGFMLSMQAIIKGFPSIINTLGVGMLFFFILSIVGVHFFKGMLYYCAKTNMANDGAELTQMNIYFCMDNGGEWKNNDITFDNMFISFVTLFELMTAKSWRLIVTELAADYGIDTSQSKDRNYNTAFFVILCTIVGYLYIRAIITGLITFIFNREKEEIQGITNLHYAQRKWVNLSRVIFKAAPVKRVLYVTFPLV